jgi:putative copper resistance protein D
MMLLIKVALLGGLLFLGAMNFRTVERLRRDPAASILRLRRFAEAEIGIGFTAIFAAASLTSVPPAVDLQQDRVTLAEIVERNIPKWPRLVSPDHDLTAIPVRQRELDAAAEGGAPAQLAYVPGTGVPPPRNAFDVAWSEYNHHWAGFVVLAIGLLALAERTGRAPWARQWPLMFLVLAFFLFLRSDSEAWPFGRLGFFESFRDPEVVQHRAFMVLIVAFAFFEWAVRTGRVRSRGPALVFPLASAVAGALLLTHSHTIGNVKELLLIEMTHAPLALFGLAAGWSRWIELRAGPAESRVAAWVWPVCFVFVGLILVLYREA